ncbi:bifunctional diaminohydroxyphosphoribosylaminopyrimidine deaminase/5-amino-6-(5-phosphoribosylamino)uracil reductase RibD [Corynebacterium sp. H128]|uniref:bifunctional diaminohydroxyphosphoribosylaminopyrimidine deaminase/5-amino-6-(5-phosphoribosylamino)uracil reductase RibD n=1 Tax=Corynebacterium sp. H128 TaxID=3133427 RepID=UPI003095699C
MDATAVDLALSAALAAGDHVRGTTSPNPPVGCAIISPEGELLGTGATQPPGQGRGEHAEVVALRNAGARARGASAVVTLEPCNHTGRTGPCSHALVAAGVSEVYYATADPNPLAAGGAEYLRNCGVATTFLDIEVAALQPWLHSVRTGRPHVTVKTASTLDGYSAAQDGSSQWITGEQARAHAHRDRSLRDAIIVGTGTVLADNPRLSAREETGNLYPKQPRRVVVGKRALPADAHLVAADVARFDTLAQALNALWEAGARDILIEGGPTLVGGALQQGLVNQLHAYISPALLGAGLAPMVLSLTGETSISDLIRLKLAKVEQLGNDVLIVADVAAK